MTALTLAKKIAALAFSKKASDVRLLDLRKVSDVADFFVVCSADSDTQVKAIADAVLDGMALADVHPWHREGVSQKQWILLDYVDVVVHVFHRDARTFYALEKLWGDAKVTELSDAPAPAGKAPARRKAAGKKVAAPKAAAKKTAAKTPGRKTAAGKAADAPPRRVRPKK